MENKDQQFLECYREIEEWVLNNLNVVEMKDLEQTSFILPNTTETLFSQQKKA